MFVAGGVWFAHAVPGKVWYPVTDLQVKKWTEWTTSPLLAQWVRGVNSSPNPNLTWSYSLWVLWAFPCREPLTSSPGLPGLPLEEVCASLPSLGTMQQDPHAACSWCWVNLLFLCIFSCLPPLLCDLWCSSTCPFSGILHSFFILTLLICSITREPFLLHHLTQKLQ